MKRGNLAPGLLILAAIALAVACSAQQPPQPRKAYATAPAPALAPSHAPAPALDIDALASQPAARLLDEEVLANRIRVVVRAPELDCVRHTLEGMYPLTVDNEGEASSETRGDADQSAWTRGYVTVGEDDGIEIIVPAASTSDGEMCLDPNSPGARDSQQRYLVFTTRDVNEPLSSDAHDWLQAQGEADFPVTVEDGYTSRHSSAAGLAAQLESNSSGT